MQERVRYSAGNCCDNGGVCPGVTIYLRNILGIGFGLDCLAWLGVDFGVGAIFAALGEVGLIILVTARKLRNIGRLQSS